MCFFCWTSWSQKNARWNQSYSFLNAWFYLTLIQITWEEGTSLSLFPGMIPEPDKFLVYVGTAWYIVLHFMALHRFFFFFTNRRQDLSPAKRLWLALLRYLFYGGVWNWINSHSFLLGFGLQLSAVSQSLTLPVHLARRWLQLPEKASPLHLLGLINKRNCWGSSSLTFAQGKFFSNEGWEIAVCPRRMIMGPTSESQLWHAVWYMILTLI